MLSHRVEDAQQLCMDLLCALPRRRLEPRQLEPYERLEWACEYTVDAPKNSRP
jgi:hypothetical protein